MKYYRVVVEPRNLGDFGVVCISDTLVCESEKEREERYYEMCKEIARQIKHYVDNVGAVYIEEVDDDEL